MNIMVGSQDQKHARESLYNKRIRELTHGFVYIYVRCLISRFMSRENITLSYKSLKDALLKLVRKSNSFFLLCVALTSVMVLVFKRINNFFCVQANKIIKSSNIVRDQISLTMAVTTSFCLFFNFPVISS